MIFSANFQQGKYFLSEIFLHRRSQQKCFSWKSVRVSTDVCIEPRGEEFAFNFTKKRGFKQSASMAHTLKVILQISGMWNWMIPISDKH